MKKFTSIVMTIALATTMISNVFAGGLNPVMPTAANGLINFVLGVVKLIANAFAIGMLLYLGIKYVMASANEKADLKKGSISYVIGAMIIFGATFIISVVQDLTEELGATTGTTGG